jgi:P27 family predicted phage terminase small subunit
MKKEPPDNLSEEAQSLWRQIVQEYELDDSLGMLLLARALEAFDRMRQAQMVIKEHGPVFIDRFKQLRANPACTIERDAGAAMLQALRQLNIDVEVVSPRTGRPPGR